MRTLIPRAIGSPARAGLIAFLLLLPAFALMKATAPHDSFPLTRGQAIVAAKSDWRTQRFLRMESYDRVRISPVDSKLERVTFLHGYHLIADVGIDHAGHVTRVGGRDPGLPESGSQIVNFGPMLALLTLLFVLATATVPLVSVRNLDVLAAASLTLPVFLLNHTLVEPSVWVAYPPLVYLAVRCVGVGLGRWRHGEQRTSLYWHLTSRWPPAQRKRLLTYVVAAIAATAAMVIPSSSGASDVAYAAISGATDLLHGVVPYGHIPDFIVHGDTYPLLTYVAYIPAALVAPIADVWDDPTAGLVLNAAATLLAAAGMYRLGVRYAKGTDPAGAADVDAEPPSVAGMRTALAFFAFAPVLLAASGGSNDTMLVLCLVGVFLWFHHPRRSALAIGVAAWVKIIPVLALPLWLARMPRRAALQAVGLLALLSAALCGVLVALGGPDAVPAMLRAIAFQLDRSSLHSLWVGMNLPGLQPVAEAALFATIAMAAVAIWRDRSLAVDMCRVAALLAGIELASQVAANYWTWAYTPWVIVPVLLSLLAPVRARAPASALARPAA